MKLSTTRRPYRHYDSPRHYLLAALVCIFLHSEATAEIGGSAGIEYGDKLAGRLETVGPITYGDGTVGAAALFTMTKPYTNDEPYTKRATEAACAILGSRIVKDVEQLRPGSYDTLAIIFKWVGPPENGVSPVMNYTSVFNVADCSHIGANR